MEADRRRRHPLSCSEATARTYGKGPPPAALKPSATPDAALYDILLEEQDLHLPGGVAQQLLSTIPLSTSIRTPVGTELPPESSGNADVSPGEKQSIPAMEPFSRVPRPRNSNRGHLTPQKPPRHRPSMTDSENRIASHRIASHRIESHRIASNRIESNRIESNRIESNRREPTRTDANRREPTRTDANRREPTRTDATSSRTLAFRACRFCDPVFARGRRLLSSAGN